MLKIDGIALYPDDFLDQDEYLTLRSSDLSIKKSLVDFDSDSTHLAYAI